MKIALDPWMIRNRSWDQVCGFAADTGYEWLELSPRDDFIPLFVGPRANQHSIGDLRRALRAHGVSLASIWTVYRWSEPRDRDAREAAIRYWKRFVQVAADLGCEHLNTEFSGDPAAADASEAAFWQSIEEVIPEIERLGLTMAIEPHPGDFVEDHRDAVAIVRAIGSAHVGYLYCLPHTFHMGGQIAEMLRDSADVLTHVHLADTFDHRIPVRYIVNPLDSTARVHQHLNLGEGEVDWPSCASALKEIEFDGIVTNSVFAWPDRADWSARLMRDSIRTSLA